MSLAFQLNQYMDQYCLHIISEVKQNPTLLAM